MSASDTLRLLTLLLAALSAGLVALFITYLRKLYDPETRGRLPGRFIAARVGVLVLALLTIAMVASAVAGAHHIVGALWLNFAARTVVVSCLTGVFLALSSWQAVMLEKRYHGRHPRLDSAIDHMLHIGR